MVALGADALLHARSLSENICDYASKEENAHVAREWVVLPGNCRIHYDAHGAQ